MNDLLSSKSFQSIPDVEADLVGGVPATELTSSVGEKGLATFFEDIDILKREMDDIKHLLAKLKRSNEYSRAASIKSIRIRIDANVAEVLHKAIFIKSKLESVDKSNEANHTLPGCEPGSTTDRTRMTITNGVRKSLKDLMDDFQALRQKMSQQHRDAIDRMYYTITGERASEAVIDSMLEEEGGGENFLQTALREQGRRQVIETIQEIRERHDAVKEFERNLLELHQIFLDMAVLADVQGQQIDNIEAVVMRASSFVNTGHEQLQSAYKRTSSSFWFLD
ncbi:hypothetical protein L7F22_009528 [Adiantum nelumboides]|nr:hypothetical protein [Adiantum nelumboides]